MLELSRSDEWLREVISYCHAMQCTDRFFRGFRCRRGRSMALARSSGRKLFTSGPQSGGLLPRQTQEVDWRNTAAAVDSPPSGIDCLMDPFLQFLCWRYPCFAKRGSQPFGFSRALRRSCYPRLAATLQSQRAVRVDADPAHAR